MSTVRESIEIAVPAPVAYEQLCHFENYPLFMSGVMDMKTIDASTTHMVLDIGGNRAEFDARITESRPGEFLCWEAVNGPQVSESMRLEAMSDTMTRVIAELQVDARELMPSETHANEVLNRRLKADLKGFKRLCEEHAAATRPIATPAIMARGMATTGTAGHATNERPAKSAPTKGNLGPMRHTPMPGTPVPNKDMALTDPDIRDTATPIGGPEPDAHDTF